MIKNLLKSKKRRCNRNFHIVFAGDFSDVYAYSRVQCVREEKSQRF